MYMNATFLHNVFRRVVRQTNLICMGFDPTQCYLDTLFQDVAKLSCELHTAATRHVGHFYEKYAAITTRTVGYEACDDTRTTTLLVSDLSNLNNGQECRIFCLPSATAEEKGIKKMHRMESPCLLCNLLIVFLNT
jgi:hypothetical protein